ncbi:MAG: hypothetical protein AYL31_002730 [Candidatus Bathyarchaeota archaeon B26-1]|nr:MAG: hypothetical protein AYL31_002730 [Candidatus Bathyarchaeota archaeon B26-1]
MIHPVTFELLGKGRELADRLGVDLSAVLLGYGVEDEAFNLIRHGADRVYLFEDRSLKEFDAVRYKENIVPLLREVKPSVFLVGATRIGRSLAPRVAAALRTGLTADCTDLDVDEEGNLIQVRPAFSGNIMAVIRTRTRPQIATVRYKVMKPPEPDPKRRGEIIRRDVKVVEDSGLRILKKERVRGVDLTEAEVIVSCGRGVKRREDLVIFKELAAVLGGVFGSSRPLVDCGWVERERQVGFSGNVVKPKVYIACGISGSPQHLFGMRDSDVIIAINKDPSAPIFNVADYGFVGDMYEIVPLLVKKIKDLERAGLDRS